MVNQDVRTNEIVALQNEVGLLLLPGPFADLY